MVQTSSDENEVQTLKLLTYKQSLWFNADLIEVADQSDAQDFIACEEVQDVLEWKWLGRMSAANSKLLVRYITSSPGSTSSTFLGIFRYKFSEFWTLVHG